MKAKSMTRKASAKDREAFVPRIEAVVRQAGGRDDLDSTMRGFGFVVPITRCGPLRVCPYEPLSGSAVGWVACRFLYPEVAVGILGTLALNTYSGKWNFHFGSRVSQDEAVAEFECSLRHILIPGYGRPEAAPDHVGHLEASPAVSQNKGNCR